MEVVVVLVLPRAAAAVAAGAFRRLDAIHVMGLLNLFSLIGEDDKAAFFLCLLLLSYKEGDGRNGDDAFATAFAAELGFEWEAVFFDLMFRLYVQIRRRGWSYDG